MLNSFSLHSKETFAQYLHNIKFRYVAQRIWRDKREIIPIQFAARQQKHSFVGQSRCMYEISDIA
jgi:hypothetical protein